MAASGRPSLFVYQRMCVPPGPVYRLERRTDMHVSTLREFVKALGGRLELIASFPDGSYHIKQFEQE
jgi:hypothetical protein